MKKIVAVVGMLLTFFLLYFLQINFFSWFNIAGVKPNLFIVLVLCIGLFAGKNIAMPVGFIIGLYLDVLTGSQIGISALMYMAIGFIGEILDKNFTKDSKISIVLMVAGSTIIFETVLYVYAIVRNSIPVDVVGFIKIALIETVFNCLMATILYSLISGAGEFLEETFKKRELRSRIF